MLGISRKSLNFFWTTVAEDTCIDGKFSPLLLRSTVPLSFLHQPPFLTCPYSLISLTWERLYCSCSRTLRLTTLPSWTCRHKEGQWTMQAAEYLEHIAHRARRSCAKEHTTHVHVMVTLFECLLAYSDPYMFLHVHFIQKKIVLYTDHCHWHLQIHMQ